jgi:hypothetical protein
MNNDQGPIPKFAVVISVLMILVGLFFAYALFFNAAAFMKDVDTANPSIHRMIFSLGARSFSMAIALLLALLFKSRLGLIAVLSMRVITEALDMVAALGAAADNPGLVVIPVVIIVLEAAAIVQLWRNLRAPAI